MIILGIDPGIASCGWSVIEQELRIKNLELRTDKSKPRIKNQELRTIDCGVIKTLQSETLGRRLGIIGLELEKIIQKFMPTTAAVEEIFFAKNVKTAIIVSHARGAVLLTCAKMGLDIFEFTPLQIKQALTGYGQASKNQVGYMVKNILNLKDLPKDDNTVDALAIGICMAHSVRR